MRVALLQISCVCHHMAPVARGRPAGPVTDQPNNGLLLLPGLLLCTTLLLAITEQRNAFANHHLFPCSWWQLPITYFKCPRKGTVSKRRKKQFFRDFLSVPTLIKQHNLSLSYSSWGTIWRTRHCAQQCNEHLHAEDTSLEASRAVDIPDIPFDHMITTFCSEEVHFSSLLTTCSTKLDITALPLIYIAKIKWLLKEAVKRN